MSKQRRHLAPRDYFDGAESTDFPTDYPDETPPAPPLLEERSPRRFGTSSASSASSASSEHGKRRRHTRRGGAPAMFARAGALAGDGAGHFFARLDSATQASEPGVAPPPDAPDSSPRPNGS